MTKADDQAHLRYRRAARLCVDMLSDTPDSEMRVALLKIAQICMRLADPQPASQQQQQIQPKEPAVDDPSPLGRLGHLSRNSPSDARPGCVTEGQCHGRWSQLTPPFAPSAERQCGSFVLRTDQGGIAEPMNAPNASTGRPSPLGASSPGRRLVDTGRKRTVYGRRDR